MPVVSALLVFHRDSPFLRPAIASLLAQTLRDLEIVLVDNGTGLSAEDLGDVGRDVRMRWLRLPANRGIPAGHNAGVAAARGEFVALLDYDDVALPHRLERQVERLRKEPDLGLVSSLAETIDEHGTVIGREFALIEPAAQRSYTQFAAPVVTPAYTGRRELFVRHPYRTEFEVGADFDFLARAAETTAMAAVEEVLLRYRRHEAQTTRTRAGLIEAQRCAIRTLTARRRAGFGEDFAATLAAVERDLTPSESCRRWGERNLSEGLAVLAAYHARRTLVLDRSVPRAAQAMSLGARAILLARATERRLATRMFFSGPVRALRLQPA